jgi:hypothetical protein
MVDERRGSLPSMGWIVRRRPKLSREIRDKLEKYRLQDTNHNWKYEH